MKTILSSQTMDIPEGVKVKVNAKIVEVEGPRGKLTRNFKHLNLDFQLIEGGKKLKVDAWFGSQKTMAAIRTSISHVQNLITGVTKGYRYKMSALYQLHLVKAEIARTFIPKEFKLVEAFGYTLGGFFLAHYDDRPDAMFDELVVIAGIVWNPPTSCAWAARVLVSSHDACSHGRKGFQVMSAFSRRWFVDGIPIRVSRNYESIGIAYPNKQGMRVYSSIWNADYWATRGGLEKINWKILCVERATSQKEIKKAYYKLALRLHPDKNPGDEEAKEKFQLLQKVISILGDEEKRTLYDQTGCVDDGALSGEAAENLQEFFRTLYNKVTEADIEEFEANYRGSDSDKNDLKELYTKFKGNMNRIFCSMLCSEPKLDSHRFKDIIDEAIAEGELKTTKAYQKWANQVSEMNPPADPTVRRPKLKKREETDLVAAITRHRGERKDAFNSIISSVMRQCILSC